MLRKLILLALLAAPGFAHAAIAIVQHTSARCTTSPCTVTLSTVAAGDAIIIFPGGSTGATLTSITDSNGTVSTARTMAFPSTVAAGIYYVANTASGTHTITETLSANINIELYAAEYSGMSTSAPFDKSSAVANGSTFNPTSATITPTGNNELLVGFVVVSGSSVTFSSWGSSMTQVDTQAGGPSSAWAAVAQTTGTSGSATATPSGSNANWVAVAAFFQGAGSCTHSGITSAGAIAVPNGSSGSYRLANGNIGTPDCITVSYPNSAGGIAVN